MPLNEIIVACVGTQKDMPKPEKIEMEDKEC